jgi:F-type H+-transporting ATPase subunit b
MDILFEWLKEPEFWVGLGLVILIAIFLYQRVPAFVTAALDSRANAIAKELDEARRLREEAAALLARFKTKAAEAEQEAAGIVTEAKEEAERFAVEARAQLVQQIERRLKQAQDKIAQAEAHALAEIRAKAADAAVDAAEKLIAQRTDAGKASALISQSLKELPAKLG